jgi:hypothetical protein
MESFLGIEMMQLQVNKAKDPRTKEVKKQDEIKQQKLFETVFGQEIGAAKALDDRAKTETRRRERETFCQACNRQPGENERFMRCKKCWDTIQRDVSYCSKYVSLYPV